MDKLPLILIFAAVGLTIAGVLWSYFNNRQVVEPNNRERLVIQEVLTGKMQVLGPGTHFLPSGWKELVRVDLNREPKQVPASSGGEGEEFRTSEGVLGRIEYRYDMVSGREFDQSTGRLILPDQVDNPDASVKEWVIALAVTRIDFEARHERIAAVVSAAIETELGSYTSDQLFRTANSGGFSIPAAAVPELGLNQVVVERADQLYTELAKCIEAKANQHLIFVGINIVGFQLTNLKPASANLQQSLEQEVRTQRHTAAAHQLIMTAGVGANISFREALVATDPTALGVVAQAEATVEAAQAFGEAIKVGTEKIAEGMRHFGRGT